MFRKLDELTEQKKTTLQELNDAATVVVNVKSAYNNRKNQFTLHTNFKEKGLTNQGMQKAYVDSQCKNLKRNVELAEVKMKTCEMQVKSLNQQIEIEMLRIKMSGE